MDKAVISVPARHHSPFLAIDPTKGPQNSMTRAKLEEIVFPMVERCKAPLLDALREAKLTPDEIDKILLIGGPTRIKYFYK